MGWSPIPGGESNGNRGQSATLGYALLFGITILGVGAIITFGSVALSDTQQVSDVERVEQGMSQFDADAAEVALGDSEVKTVEFGQSDGSYDVESGGTITVTHINYDGSNDEQLYQGSLGSLVYRNEGTTIAYQAGGVWRVEDNGNARMVSPPEFHYRDGTLTLPVVKTQGSGSVSGQSSATVQPTGNPFEQAYPDQTKAYPDGDLYINPVEKGHIEITVESRYAAAWKEYFETRTDGTATYSDGGTPGDPSDDAATLTLLTLGQQGPFNVPADQKTGGSLEVRGLETGKHSLNQFQYKIFADDKTSSEFKNLQWSMYAKQGDQHIELSFPSGNVGCGGSAEMYIYYTPDDHATFHMWKTTYTVMCNDEDGDTDNDPTITIDLTSPQVAEYTDDKGPSILQKFGTESNGATHDNSLNFDQHTDPTENAYPDEGTSLTYSKGSTEELVHVIQHYFALMGPNFDLKVQDQQKGQAGVDEAPSEGVIYYTGGDSVVTYLHVSENRIEVTLN